MSSLKGVLVGIALISISGLAWSDGERLDRRSGVKSGTTRTYWIQADEVLWDYAPSGMNLMQGRPFEGDELVFVSHGDGLIGRVYKKAVYRQYTEGWSSLIPRGPREEHLGTLGPVLRGEVGDTIVVHFRNNTENQTLSVHPHGVFYVKNSEGVSYDDGTSGADKLDDAVPPGESWTYSWQIPDRAGPGPNDPSSIAWPYHSHVDEPADTNAGLIGMIAVTRRGMAKSNGSPRGVDREFFSMFNVFDENASLYLDENLELFDGDLDHPEFEESNLMHGINGLLWGNDTGYTMYVGERVRWYNLAMGTEVDLHTPHWHGVTLLHNGNRVDVTVVLPAESQTLDFRPDNPGIWMYHCHINDHLSAGMMTLFTVLPDINEGRR